MTLKQSIGLAVVVFWCLMNLLLIKRQLWAPPPPLFISGTEAIIEATQEWWGVYYRGEKIGFTSQSIEPNSDGYLLRDDSLLRLNLLGTTQRALTRLAMNVDKEWVLKDFNFELQSNDMRFKSRGKIVPGKLHLEIESADYTSTQQIALTQPPYLAAALKPLVATQQLEPGKEHFFTIFDPSTLAQQITSIVIEGREQILVGDKTEPAIKLRQKFKGLSVVSWIDGRGRTLKEESPGGFALRREAPQQAKSFAESRAVPLDMIADASIAVGEVIAQPQSRSALRLRLSGVNMANFALDHGRQKFSGNELWVEREKVGPSDTYKIPLQDRRFSSFLRPTAFLQSDHPRIRAHARQILGDETDAYRAILRLKTSVYNEIQKTADHQYPQRSRSALQQKRRLQRTYRSVQRARSRCRHSSQNRRRDGLFTRRVLLSCVVRSVAWPMDLVRLRARSISRRCDPHQICRRRNRPADRYSAVDRQPENRSSRTTII